MRNTRVLLLAAGVGSRLRPLTDTLPKCLAPIAGRPLLDYWFDRFASAGLEEVLINTHHLAHQVRRYLRDVERRTGVRVTEAYEPELLGSAGTVRANRSWVEGAEDCLLVYADNLSEVDLGDLLRFHREHSDPFSMMLFRAPNPRACGIAELDAEDRVVGFVEKPEHPVGDLANAGLYVVSAEAYREIADMDAFDLGHDVLPRFVGRMRGWRFDGYHRDIGDRTALEQASAHVERQRGAGKP